MTSDLTTVHDRNPSGYGTGGWPSLDDAPAAVPHFTRGFQSAKSPFGLGSQVQTWRYQMPRLSARFRDWPMTRGGSAAVHAAIGTRCSTPFSLKLPSALRS